MIIQVLLILQLMSYLNAVLYIQAPKHISKHELDGIIKNIAKPLSVLRKALGNRQLEYEFPYAPKHGRHVDSPHMRRSQNSSEEEANNRRNTIKSLLPLPAQVKKPLTTTDLPKTIKDERTIKLKRKRASKQKAATMVKTTTITTNFDNEAPEFDDLTEPIEATESVNTADPAEDTETPEEIETTMLVKEKPPVNIDDLKKAIDIVSKKYETLTNNAGNATSATITKRPVNLDDMKKVFAKYERKIIRAGTKNITNKDPFCNEEKILEEALSPALVKDIKAALFGDVGHDGLREGDSLNNSEFALEVQARRFGSKPGEKPRHIDGSLKLTSKLTKGSKTKSKKTTTQSALKVIPERLEKISAILLKVLRKGNRTNKKSKASKRPLKTVSKLRSSDVTSGSKTRLRKMSKSIRKSTNTSTSKKSKTTIKIKRKKNKKGRSSTSS